MNTTTSSLPEMINSSRAVLLQPSIQTFEQFEKRGSTRDALVYVGAAALIAGVASMVFGLIGGIGAAITALLIALIGTVARFLIFAFTIYFVGRQQGGTGTQDEVFYSTSLYVAPLAAIVGVVSAIPFLNCALLPVTFALGLYQIYLGYLAARASMNLDQTKAIISVVVAYLAQFIIGLVVGGILAGLLVAGSRGA